MATEASLNHETLEFMKSIGLTKTMSEEFSSVAEKREKKTKENVQMKAPTKPIEKKNGKDKSKDKSIQPKSQGKPQIPQQKPQKQHQEDKQKVKARKWGKEGKEVKVQNQTPELVIKGNVKPSPTELNWLHVKVDANQRILSSFEENKWYDLVTPFDQVDFQNYKISKQSLEQINSAVESLFNQEVSKYHRNKSASNDADEKWMNDVIRSGTLSDKVAALALRVQQSPPHELESLDLLISMALKKEQRTSQLALEALKDLLIHNLLPDRRLIPYSLRPLGHPSMSLSILLTFWYENELIKRIESIMSALDTGLKSTVDFFKMKCMDIVANWISSKPEQENVLLTFLVNKLGDPSSKVASKCIALLGNVLYQHPAMKLVMIREVRQLISRSNLIPRAVYSGIIFLTQIKLNSQENKVAVELVDCYVSLFEKAVTQDTLGSKLLAALLTGINRAFPFLVNKTSLTKHTDALFKIVHQSSFSSATQALTLLSYLALGHQPEKSSSSSNKKKAAIAAAAETGTETNSNANSQSPQDGNSELISRYYNSLYSKLLSDEILTRSHNTLFLNLLFRSMKRDQVDLRVLGFCKRILICSTHATPPIAAGLIFLVSEVCRLRPTLIEKLLSTLEPCPPESDSTSFPASPQEDSYFLLGNFDGSKRNPSYACQNASNSWELVLFKSHFNPSVQSFAKSFLEPTPAAAAAAGTEATPHTISYSGDPTIDFSITSFLNRFAYKNPKKQQVDQRRKRSQVLSEEPINLDLGGAISSAAEEVVAPEKVFFYKFFGERNRLIAEGKSRKKKKRRVDEDDEDDEDRSDLGSDFDEAEIDRFADKLADELMDNYAAGNPDIDGDDDGDDDEDDDFDRDGDGDEDFDEENFGDDVEEGVDDDDSDTPRFEDDEVYGDDDEEDIDFEEMAKGKMKKGSATTKSKEKKTNKRKKGGDDDVFAAAEDFEDDMEANLVGVVGNESNQQNEEVRSKKSKKRSRRG